MEVQVLGCSPVATQGRASQSVTAGNTGAKCRHAEKAADPNAEDGPGVAGRTQ